MSELAVLAFVALPFVGLVIWSMFEILGRKDLRAARRIAWIAVIILLPVVGLASYVVVRPPKAVRLTGGRSDAAAAETLVLLAERRQRGELSDDDYHVAVAAISPPR